MPKVNLRDTAFLIPVKIDNQDRLNNLRIVIKYITEFFNVHLKVCEFDKEKKIDFESGLINKIDYEFIKTEDVFFHKTAYLNYMIDKTTEKYINIYSSDVVMLLYQYIAPVLIMEKYKYDCVLSHNALEISILKEFHSLFEETLNLLNYKVADMENFYKKTYGGSIYFQRDALIKIGKCEEQLMTNLFDNELLFYRIIKNRLKVCQLNSPVFHLEHEKENKEFQEDIDFFNGELKK